MRSAGRYETTHRVPIRANLTLIPKRACFSCVPNGKENVAIGMSPATIAIGMLPELEPELLLEVYASGIFPMADDDGRICWFSPDPRAVIELDDLKVSRSLRQAVKHGTFEIAVNRDFDAVIRACADREEGTWISPDIIEAYSHLHDLGFVHTVEAYRDSRLAGGLYGVSIGGAFFGESMFHFVTDASKVALVHLVHRMKQRDMTLLDVQFLTDHLQRLGAIEIPRTEYLRRLQDAMRNPTSFADE